MKIYIGTPPGTVCHHDGTPLDPRLDLANKNPTGFAWGYGGSGPSQLALAILADYLGNDDRAYQLHQAFKWRVIARLPENREWTLDGKQINQVIQQIEAEEEMPFCP